MTAHAPVVAVIEDEQQMRRFLRTLLETHGYRPLEADSAAAGLALVAAHRPDVVLLDLGLPDSDGIELMRRIREWSDVPVIVLSARGHEDGKVLALDTGADDYLTKPFGARELLARVRVAVRRASRISGRTASVCESGELRIDLSARRVTVRGEAVHLTPIEYRLLAMLARHVGRVLTHRDLLKEVWGPNLTGHAHYVRVYMAQLRRKIEIDPARPRYLLTESGVGYRLADGS